MCLTWKQCAIAREGDFSAFRDRLPPLVRSVNEWDGLRCMAYNAVAPQHPTRRVGGAMSEAVEFL
jgi:hypothetical protein